MTQLDKLYNTFSNLEKNYKRSKKSRTDFIKDKFGGDIDIGSFLIMNALAAQEFTDSEDIAKYSTVREVISMLKEHKDHLDSLSTFDQSSHDARDILINAMDRAAPYRILSQADLYRRYGSLHQRIYHNVTAVSPLLSSPFVRICTPAMRTLFSCYSSEDIQLGDLLEKQRVGNFYVKSARTDPKF